MLFKLDAITILPIPCVKHVLRIVFICMWQLSNSQTSMYIRIFQEVCFKWTFLGFSAKYPWVQLISQVLLTEVLKNLYDRNQRFLDLIFSYKYLEPSVVQVQWLNSLACFLIFRSSGFGWRGKDNSISSVQNLKMIN